MITWRQYRRITEKNWMGRKVKLLREIRIREQIFPAGMIFTIRRKYKGFNLYAESTCPHCGVGKRYWIHHVNPTDLQLIEEEPDADGN